ncbi:hypothetical protein FOVSG1_002935 [Fusarium oxysporum f. sp. vasinfectum]
MKNQLRDKYTGVDFDKMDGPGLPDEESDDDNNLPSSVNTKSSKSLKLRKRTMTNSPGRSSSRADDEEETSQKGGTSLPPLKRSARLDKRRRNAVDEDSGDETSAVGIKRGRSITIKKEPEIDDVGEQQPSSYHRQTPQVLQDFRLPGVPAAEGYSTRHAGIDPRYNLMGGDPRVSNGYLPTSDYCMGGDPRASNGYLPTTRDLRSPYPERDLGQRGRPSTIDVPINEEIEPAAIVRLRQEMNTRLQSQEQCHFDEIRTVREEMRAMRTEFEQKLFDYKQEHEKSIIKLVNAVSLAGHNNK